MNVSVPLIQIPGKFSSRDRDGRTEERYSESSTCSYQSMGDGSTLGEPDMLIKFLWRNSTVLF